MSLAMIFGAASASTCGGLKLNRIVALYKVLVWHFRQISLKPDEHKHYELNGKELKELSETDTLSKFWD